MDLNDPDLNELFVRIRNEATFMVRPIAARLVHPFTYEILEDGEDYEVMEFRKGDRVCAIWALDRQGKRIPLAMDIPPLDEIIEKQPA